MSHNTHAKALLASVGKVCNERDEHAQALLDSNKKLCDERDEQKNVLEQLKEQLLR